jgi:dienelactone hydrolase
MGLVMLGAALGGLPAHAADAGQGRPDGLPGSPSAARLPSALEPMAAQAAPVGRTTVRLVLAERRVEMDVYRPVGPVRGAVILSHGFTRSRSTLGEHAAALAAAGALAITPDLPYTFDFQRNAQALAALVALLRAGGGAEGVLGGPIGRVVLVGFSAGGLSSLLAAGAPGVVGYVGLDPFDRVRGGAALGLDSAPGLRTEAVLLRAPPSRCNAQAVAAPWGAALPALVSDRVMADASHCDFEAPSDWMCRLACGAPDPQRQAQVRATLLSAVARWLPEPGGNGPVAGQPDDAAARRGPDDAADPDPGAGEAHTR